jgi:tyrosine-protein kinase Etk/Wzc
LLISLTILAISITYAIIAPDIYTASTVLKISQLRGNILDQDVVPVQEYRTMENNQFIENEIETIKNPAIVEQVARTMLDTFKVLNKRDNFSLILEKDYFNEVQPELKSYGSIVDIVSQKVDISQKEKLNFINITAESPSPYEAALIANAYAKAYKDFNLLDNRKQLTTIREFLAEQLQEKLDELVTAENNIKTYQLKGGVIVLDQQAQNLVNTISGFQSERDASRIEMSMSKERLDQLRKELDKRDPSIANYLKNKSNESYLTKLQEQIATLETQRDIALSGSSTKTSSGEVTKMNKQIDDLKDKLKRSLEEYQSMISAASPEEIKQLSGELFQEEVRYQSLRSQYNQLNSVINNWEGRFNQLPAKSLDLARLERERQSIERLYLHLEEKYQEAVINEQSTPGNVLIMNTAQPPSSPSKPNRSLIVLFGLIVGTGIGFGFIYVKNYFDRTIKTPEDIENRNINVLAWIPKVKDLETKDGESELVVAKNPDSILSEAFRTLRTRIQFSKISEGAKTILITSSAPGEGKTLVSVNLSATFALANKRTVILDCDLRKPKVYTVFNEKESPGFLDYLFGKTAYENVIRKSEIRNLDFITAGTIPPNPSEIIGSRVMKAFIQKLKEDYDIVIVDSPPVMAVSDAEILSRLVDITLFVVSANNTELDWMQESVDLLKQEQDSFSGVLLNNFNYKSGYHAYYKYYEHYSDNGNSKRRVKIS